MISQVAKIKTIITNSEIEAFLLESRYIKKYKPKYNVKLTDDKAYLMVRITIKDNYPKVLLTRHLEDNPSSGGSIYFGPFPNSALVLRLVLRTIRKIFPYQSVLNHPKKICLYHHLGLCPCPPVFDSRQYQKEYRKNIKHIVNFLNGETKKVIRDLKRERDILSKNEEFEKANILQKKIKAIELILDSKEKEMNDLINILNKNNVNVKTLEKIECFDISNISGTNAAGSMVTFIDGKKDKNWYRKFKIRTLKTSNDFGMMEEVLSRRFNHKEWTMPSLIIVDGGKGQVSSALKVLKFMNLKISIIGLAKKEEVVITSDFKEIVLPKNSDALKLVMRIRDEAHRFAIAYHRKLRSKSFLPR